MKDYAIFFTILFVAFLSLASVRVVWEGWSEYHTAQKLWEEGKKEPAITHYIRAARWYFPLIGADSKAKGTLFKIAQDYEKKGDYEKALEIYREIRAAILVDRSLYTPDKELLKQTEEHIAKLMSGGNKQKEQHYLSQLQHHIAPSPIFSFLAVITLLVWLFVTIRGLFFSVDKEGHTNKKVLGLTIIKSLVLFGLFLLFLRLS